MKERQRTGLTLEVLGPWRASVDGAPLPKLATVRAQALLAYLAVEVALGNGRQPREALTELLWPGMPPASGRKNLRQALYLLRQAVPDRPAGPPFLLADRRHVEINPAYPLELDAAVFLSLLDGPQADWSEAAELYRGDLLADLYLEDSNDFEGWAAARRQFFRERALDALESLADEALGQQDYTLARTFARRRLTIDDLQESAHTQLMKILALSGRRVEALAQYETCRRLLAEELGLEPSAEMTALFQRIEAGQAVVVGEPGPRSTRVDGAAAPMASSLPDRNLPQQTMPLIGREGEVAELAAWLDGDKPRRLVTIVGPGGIGKSRLSLEVATKLRHRFADGVYFTPLAPLDSAEGIVQAVGDAIGFRFLGDGTPREQLLAHLSDKQMLLVMDNFEHLLPGAELLAAVLAAASEIRFLATSRQRLGLAAESLFHLGGLAYPGKRDETTSAAVDQYGAVHLLHYQASLVRPDLPLDGEALVHAGRVTALVQGMPLAIILAAGWLELLSLEEIAAEIAGNLDFLEGELRDLPARQQSIRAVFHASWSRLSPAEQEAFAKLAVFRGTFSRRAAEALAGANLRTLRALVDKSLIQVNRPGRYAMLELLRQFASARLDQAGLSEQVHAAHAAHYLDALAEREADLKGRRQAAALNEIANDLQNVVAAWHWAHEHEAWDLVDRSCESLYHFCHMRGRMQEGAELLQAGSKRLQAQRPRLWARLSARSICALAEINQGPIDALATLDQCLEVAREHDDLPEMAFALLAKAFFHLSVSGDNLAGRALAEESLALFRQLGDDFYASRALHRVGYSYQVEMDLYLAFQRQSLALARSVGNLADASWALSNLGSALMEQNELAASQEYLEEAIRLSAETDSQAHLAHAFAMLGLALFLRGDMVRAQELADKSMALARKIGFKVAEGYALALGGLLASIGSDYAGAVSLAQASRTLAINPFGRFFAHWVLSIGHLGQGQLRRAGEHAAKAAQVGAEARWQPEIAYVLPALAGIRAGQGQPVRAVELLALAESHPMSAVGWQQHWPLLAETKAALRKELGDEAFDKAWAAGAALDLLEVANQLMADGPADA